MVHLKGGLIVGVGAALALGTFYGLIDLGMWLGWPIPLCLAVGGIVALGVGFGAVMMALRVRA